MTSFRTINPRFLEIARRHGREIKAPMRIEPAKNNIANPDLYVVLPGRNYGKYSYPDLLVSMRKEFFGLNWEDSHKILHEHDSFMLNPRQFVDFIRLVKSGRVYDGEGYKLNGSELDELMEDVLLEDEKGSFEWLDAGFFDDKGKRKIYYDHDMQGGRLTSKYSERLLKCLDGSCFVNLALFNRQGMPTRKSRDEDFPVYYYSPVSFKVASYQKDPHPTFNFRTSPKEYPEDLVGVRQAYVKE